MSIKKEVIAFWVSFILSMCLIYLVLSFVELDLDFRNWDVFLRGIYAFFSLLSFILSLTIAAYTVNKD